MKPIFLLLSLLTLAKMADGQTRAFAPIGAQWYYNAMAGGLAPYDSEYYLLKTSEKSKLVNK